MARKRSFAQSEERTDLDISPLIDMVFILLIFFMVTTTFVKDLDLELERPSASSAERASTKALRVHIDRHGEIYVDNQSVRPWMVQSHVRSALRAKATGEVLVITDLSVRAQALLHVVDQCRLAGAKDVGVATAQEAG